ncbi:MAG: outer membrane beta-barrel protein [Acidobacteria bacterium]|nr:outer membrane beta-barrel protein [Acidobacteriota bacterium]
MTLPVAAQEAPKAEIFGGYSFSSLETGNGLKRLSLNGWNASVAGNVNRFLGFVGDFSGQYGSQSSVKHNVHTFLFGPRFSYRKNRKVTLFVHALFGALRAHKDSSLSGQAQNKTVFGLALGGGLDVRATNSIAFRALQADYLLSRFDESAGIVCVQSVLPPCAGTLPGTQHNFRFSAGIVFRFGK